MTTLGDFITELQIIADEVGRNVEVTVEAPDQYGDPGDYLPTAIVHDESAEGGFLWVRLCRLH